MRSFLGGSGASFQKSPRRPTFILSSALFTHNAMWCFHLLAVVCYKVLIMDIFTLGGMTQGEHGRLTGMKEIPIGQIRERVVSETESSRTSFSTRLVDEVGFTEVGTEKKTPAKR